MKTIFYSFFAVIVSLLCISFASAATVPWDRIQVGTQAPLYGDGIRVIASSTIGGGTQTTGLTVSGGATTTGITTLTVNTSGYQPPPGNNILHIIGEDSASARVTLDAFTSAGGGPNFIYRAAGGTAAAPTALASQALLGNIAFFGYGATGYTSSNRSAILVNAAEDWTDSAQGTFMRFYTTPLGGVSSSERVRISPEGNLAIGLTDPKNPVEAAATTTDTSTGLQASFRSQRTAIVNGSLIGGFNARTNDTSLTAPGIPVVSVFGVANQTHTGATQGTDLVFTTTASGGTATNTEKVRIAGTGNVGIGDSTPNASLEIGATVTDATNIFDISGTYTSTASIASGIIDLSPTLNLGFTGTAQNLRINPVVNLTADMTSLINMNTSPTLSTGSNAITTLRVNNSGLSLGASFTGSVNSLQGYRISDIVNGGSGTVVNQAGLTIEPLAGAYHNTMILLGNANLQAGNYGILSLTTYPNVFQASTTDMTTAPLVIRSQRAAIVSGSSLGNLMFASNDTQLLASSTVNVASVGAVGAGTHSAQNQQTDLIFGTTATGGTATNTEKVRITGAGSVGIGTTSPWGMFSIHHPATGSANPIFVVASSTATATTTLFSISNTGAVQTVLGDGCVQAASGILTSTGSACGSGGGSVGNWFTPTTFGSTAANATSTLTGFTNGIYALASSTIGSGAAAGGLTVNGNATTTGSFVAPALGTAAGTFVAADPTGKLIATTTPTSGGTTVSVYATTTSQTGGGSDTVTIPPISLVAGDSLTMMGTVIMNDDCTGGATVFNILRYKLSTYAATTSMDTAKNNGGTGASCSASMSHTFVATTTVTVTPQLTSNGSTNPTDLIDFTVQKFH